MTDTIKTLGEAREIWNRNAMPTPKGEDWMDAMFNGAMSLLVLEQKHEAEIVAARAAILDLAIGIATRYDVPCDPRTEAQETAHRITNAIAALASKPAGAEQGNEQPDLIPCWHCGEARERSELELVASNDTPAKHDYSYVLVCKSTPARDDLDADPCAMREAAREDREQAVHAALRLALPILQITVEQINDAEIHHSAIIARDAVAEALGEEDENK